MPDAPTYEQLLVLVGELSARVAGQDRIIGEQADRIAELERRLGADSSNSSRPPSSDAPWDKVRAKRRSSRTRSGRNPGKQPGAASSSRSLVEDPDRVVVIEPARCGGCAQSLAEAVESGRERRQVVDVRPAPAPEITEYQRVSKTCSCCGQVATPGWDETGDERAEVVAAVGSPVRIGPQALARAALLTCGHYLPVGRSRALLPTIELRAPLASNGLPPSRGRRLGRRSSGACVDVALLPPNRRSPLARLIGDTVHRYMLISLRHPWLRWDPVPARALLGRLDPGDWSPSTRGRTLDNGRLNGRSRVEPTGARSSSTRTSPTCSSRLAPGLDPPPDPRRYLPPLTAPDLIGTPTCAPETSARIRHSHP